MRPAISAFTAIAACAALAISATARAGGQEAPPGASQAAPIGAPVDSAALDALRGGDVLVETSVLDQGEVDGNSADNVVSGLNSIDGGAFSNATGITTVIQNSGSNVLIQSGTAVNLQFVDPTP
ncbi:MAG TPA: hypothetical protein VM619_05510 [Luteimonas sp.]|nr:hypothetical protein [Luteimonas sp.]